MGLIGSMYFVGWAATVLIIPTLADKTGRKWWFVSNVIICGLTMVGFMLSKSLTFTIVLMFIAGAMNSGRVMVGFVFGQEFLTPKWAVIFGTAFHFIDNSTAVISSAYFDFISDQYIFISSVGVLLAVISSLIVLTFAPESPLW